MYIISLGNFFTVRVQAHVCSYIILCMCSAPRLPRVTIIIKNANTMKVPTESDMYSCTHSAMHAEKQHVKCIKSCQIQSPKA